MSCFFIVFKKSRIKILRFIVSTKYFYRNKAKVIILVKNRLIY
ncbi:hypothetical protein P746_01631 [Enterococcus faecalis CBRD01]|nr:hypothetical protein P746_01631 [Enterococcus faecalis CBRD01]OSH34731.1 hypothetical protein WZ342_2428 [Enterococcus faecalis]